MGIAESVSRKVSGIPRTRTLGKSVAVVAERPPGGLEASGAAGGARTSQTAFIDENMGGTVPPGLAMVAQRGASEVAGLWAAFERAFATDRKRLRRRGARLSLRRRRLSASEIASIEAVPTENEETPAETRRVALGFWFFLGFMAIANAGLDLAIFEVLGMPMVTTGVLAIAIGAAQTIALFSAGGKVRDLYANKAISLEELQGARTDVLSAQAAVTRDQASATITGTGAAEAELRSPISGTVVEKSIAVGDVVEAGSTACFKVTDPAAVWVVGHLYVRDLKRAANGDSVEIASPLLDKPLPGTVTYIGAALDPDTLTIPVRITVENPDGVLKAGMYVDAAIHPLKPEVDISLPVASVLRDSDNLPFVYVLAGPGKYARRHVTLGDQVGDSYVIDDGVQDGESVLADGAVFVQFADSLGH